MVLIELNVCHSQGANDEDDRARTINAIVTERARCARSG
jgi:hypothetical protein